MPLDVDYIAAKQAIEQLQELLSSMPHMKREQIADDIIELVDNLYLKYKDKIE